MRVFGRRTPVNYWLVGLLELCQANNFTCTVSAFIRTYDLRNLRSVLQSRGGGPFVCLAAQVTRRYDTRMPLLILSVGVTEPPVARRAVYGRRIVAGRNRRVRRPDTTAPGPPSRLSFLRWARHTSCRHSTRLAQALLRLSR